MSAKLTYSYFIPILALCLASSCSSDTPDDGDFGKGAEMQFDVSELSRATVTTGIDEFAVYGDAKFPVNSTTSPMIIFNKTKVERKGGEWHYDDIRYWFPKHEYAFVAIHPLSVLETGSRPLFANSKLSLTYTVPDKVADRNAIPDILAATHRRMYYMGDPTNTTTTLYFSHIMSMINLAPTLSDDNTDKEAYIEFHKVVLSGFKSKATFDITPAPLQTNYLTNDRVVEVAGQNGECELAVNFNSPIKVANNERGVTLFAADDAIIMLPQTFDTASKAQITLTYTLNGETEKKQAAIPLAGSGSWESGKSYTYRFTISRTGLHVETTTINDWEVANVGNINAH